MSKHSQDRGFYYLHFNNSFWRLIDNVFFDGTETFEKLRKKLFNSKDETEKANIKNDFLKLLKEQDIGLCDAIKECHNKTNSSDRGIINQQYSDLLELVRKSKVVFINGKVATLKSFIKAMGNHYSEYENKYVPLVSSSNAASTKNKKEIWYKTIKPYIQ